ncbi:hypothetical protein [Bacillus sp. FJAT-52991]|uniref:Uncharacterized protein n=1 Tax=Bacillus kandeliae TaxID=3129297 RepID=A0ABZ2NAH7_9BACI
MNMVNGFMQLFVFAIPVFFIALFTGLFFSEKRRNERFRRIEERVEQKQDRE